MSDQSQTTANPPTEPVLCKAGCGFFGNAATGGCCSKCWRDHNKKNGAGDVNSKEMKTAPSVEISRDDVPPPVSNDPKSPVESGAGKPVAAATKKGKKKKKASYKAMMTGMMSSSASRDVELEQRDKIAKGLGGGAFSKIDKI